LKNHCLACHGAEKPKGKLELSSYTTVSAILKDHRVWDVVLERVEAVEMPPDQAMRQRIPHERQAVIDWIGALRDREARTNAGDPGPIRPRRLGNAELDYTIRDLADVDIRPTREFPVDPANEAGFDNSAESLTMSPALSKKYLAATSQFADHLVLKPIGFDLAPDPALIDTDRDKYYIRRIIEFYQRHQVDYADYFAAAWRFQHREALGKLQASLLDFAGGTRLNPKYLALVSTVLAEPWPAASPLSNRKRRADRRSGRNAPDQKVIAAGRL
jgi:hypothetical protein